jgi:hypothetical protein
MQHDSPLRVQLITAVAAFCAVAAYPALALEPANLKAGSVYITPTLDAKISYVDNLFRTDNDEKNTGISTIKPRVQAWLANGMNTYSLTYELADYRYFDSSDDDFTDNTFNLDVHHEFNAKNVANVFGQYYKGHEERGTGLTDGIGELIDKPVEVDRTLFGGDYTYGSKTTKGRVGLGAKRLNHDYQNFDSVTRYRNRDRDQYNGTFFWKVGPKTDALAEVRYIDTQYDNTDPLDLAGSLDSKEYNYLVGLAWDATSKTSGSVKVGMYDRQYDSGFRKDDDGFSWEVDLTYRPRTYSWLNLETKRYSEETNGLGNAINANKNTLSWNHDWNSRVSTVMSFMYGNEDYTSSKREDDRYGVQATYNYNFRRWVDFGIGYRYEDRDSSLDFYDYSRNEVFLEAKIGL